jgi:hypothetical protein
MRTVRSLSRGLALIATLSLALPGLAFAKESQAAKAAPRPAAESAVRATPVPHVPAAPRSEVRPVPPLEGENSWMTLLGAKAWCTHDSPCTMLCTTNCCTSQNPNNCGY